MSKNIFEKLKCYCDNTEQRVLLDRLEQKIFSSEFGYEDESAPDSNYEFMTDTQAKIRQVVMALVSGVAASWLFTLAAKTKNSVVFVVTYIAMLFAAIISVVGWCSFIQGFFVRRTLVKIIKNNLRYNITVEEMEYVQKHRSSFYLALSYFIADCMKDTSFENIFKSADEARITAYFDKRKYRFHDQTEKQIVINVTTRLFLSLAKQMEENPKLKESYRMLTVESLKMENSEVMDPDQITELIMENIAGKKSFADILRTAKIEKNRLEDQRQVNNMTQAGVAANIIGQEYAHARWGNN